MAVRPASDDSSRGIDQEHPDILLLPFEHHADGVTVNGFDQFHGCPRKIQIIGWIGRLFGIRCTGVVGLGFRFNACCGSFV